MKAKSIFGVLALVAVMFCSCSDDDEVNVGPDVEKDVKPIELTSGQMKIADDMNSGFVMNLFKQYYASTGDAENSLFSPLSASYALSMLANGANGDTKEEILAVLGVADMDLDELNAMNKSLVSGMNTVDKRCTVNTANGLWLDSDFDALPEYKQVLESCYEAEISSINLQKNGKKIINAWCEKKTNGKIKDVIQEISPETDFVLANALYFKGPWQTPFEKENTKKKQFTNHDGSKSEAYFMWREDKTRYYANEKYSAIALRLGDRSFDMDIILPNEGVSLDECVASVNVESLNQIDENIALVNMYLPKFEVEGEKKLTEMLVKLGMKKSFTMESDFSGIADKKGMVNGILQKNYIKVNEAGVEAAAVTVEDMFTDLPGEEPTPIDFHVDRPFVYIIKEVNTNTILFMGAIKNL